MDKHINWFQILAEDKNVRFLINMDCTKELEEYLFEAYPHQHYRPDYMDDVEAVAEDLSIFWVILTRGHKRCLELYKELTFFAFMSVELGKFYKDKVDLNPIKVCNPKISEFELDRIRKYFMKRVKDD